MSRLPPISVLFGGVGSEREVSLSSGQNMIAALSKRFEVRGIELAEAALPKSLAGCRETVVFPALHGEFGEDGTLQAMLEAGGYAFGGCDAASSKRCMDKALIKAMAKKLKIRTPLSSLMRNPGDFQPNDLIAALGSRIVVKPNDQGSSVGVHFARGIDELGALKGVVEHGEWLAEEWIEGRELTVGILNGKALGIVEIVSSKGYYDYEAKYTPGFSSYHYPADIPSDAAVEISRSAELIFAQAGCRDFARVDFLLRGNTPFLLEINTIPGLTETSLLPKSATCLGYDFVSLAEAMVRPALERFGAQKEQI